MLTSTAEKSGRPAGTRRQGFREDIEGLRAVAIGLVLLDHLFGFPAGGFIGVDVFFVISGFLITSLLLRENERYGRISLRGFYGRRVRRIAPVATTVIVITAATTCLIYYGNWGRQVLSDAVASVLMVQNWQLIRTGTDYFAASGSSPLQHLWSLAVEEQFYLLWPLGLIAVLALLRRHPHRSGRTAVACMAVSGVVISFAISCGESFLKPGWSYFSPESRAWELMAGAALACLIPRIRLSRTWGLLLGWVGVATIISAALVIKDSWHFPGPWAALPVAGTLAVIAGGASGEAAQLGPLRARPFRFIGRISYSLYLWHYPANILLGAVLPFHSIVGLAALVLALGLSVLSYRFIEKPCSSLPIPALRASAIGSAVTVAVVCAVSAAAIFQVANPLWTRPSDVVDGGPATSSPATNQAQIARELAQGTSATTWPAAAIAALNSDTEASAAAFHYQQDGCLNDPVGLTREKLVKNADACTFGSATAQNHLLIIGDSISIGWLPSLLTGLNPAEWRVTAIGLESCPAATLSVSERLGRPAFTGACNRARQWAFSYAQETRPSRIVLSSAVGSYDRIVHPQQGRSTAQQWAEATAASIDSLPASAAVSVVQAPPESTPPTSCATRVSSPASCTTRLSSDSIHKASAERSAVEAARAKGRSVRFVETDAYFQLNGTVPELAGRFLVRADNGHVTVAYARHIGRLLTAEILGDTSTG